MKSDEILREFIGLSNEFGRDPRQVLAGGGNSSAKDCDGTMWVKASGKSMADMEPSDALRMDRTKVLALLDDPELAGSGEETEVRLAERLLEARIDPPEASMRPSVETILHAVMPQRYVMHTHPEAANAVACSREGRKAFERLGFGRGARAAWLDFADPGLPLARAIRRLLDDFSARRGGPPNVIFMANHGVVVASDGSGEVRRLARAVERCVEAAIRRRLPARPFGPAASHPLDENRMADAITNIAPLIRRQFAGPRPVATAMASADILEFVCSKNGRRLALGGPTTPDQIVYCGLDPLWIARPGAAGRTERTGKVAKEKAEAGGNGSEAYGRRADEAAVAAAFEKYRKSHGGQDPRIVLVEGVCGFAIGPTPKDADTAAAVYRNAVAVMRGASAFGGTHPLRRSTASAIDRWRWEHYRRKIAAGSLFGRAAGKVAIVTGGAQGVGKGIALGLASEGAFVAVADINFEAAKEVADEIGRLYGGGRAIPVKVDVTSEDDVRAMVAAVARRYGGLDVMISNAGILKAFKIAEFPSDTWRRILEVNLTGYFLCAKAAAPVMAAGGGGDIIQINSKSGKKGSKHNAAYAASKFGGIGLTQSIALDLVEDGIKVNCICPGNFFDLPLWSAPGGLFDQYRSKYGNVSREEVRRIYESQIPMKRGCQVSDVLKTILYILEQEYETGQAYNVTGGQEMR